MKVLHGTLSYSLSQITKCTVKIFFATYIKVLQIDVGFKNDVLVCYKGIANIFENAEYVKHPNEGIATKMICNVMGVLKT
jgi:hypothetical protein